MYRIWIEEVLGLHVRGDSLEIKPAIPDSWQEYSMVYRHRTATYEIQVARAREGRLELDGRVITDSAIPLADDGQRHLVKMQLAPVQVAEPPVFSYAANPVR